MEALLEKGVSPAGMREAFQELQAEHPGIRVIWFEAPESPARVGLGLPPGVNEAAVERTLRFSTCRATADGEANPEDEALVLQEIAATPRGDGDRSLS